MKKLIEALHVVQDECRKHCDACGECPMYDEAEQVCSVTDLKPNYWSINDEAWKVLL